jgi:alpha/beta superfamily hydrolase
MTSHSPTRLQSVTLAGPSGALEALWQDQEGRPHRFAAVVCHPHPLYGGTMHNKVVHRVASTLHDLGGAVLRFNFRGVGRSEGVHDRGVGEVEDARAALVACRVRHPEARLWVAGFSFGSGVAATLAPSEPDVERAILVAPPVHSFRFDPMRAWFKPKLVLQGGSDDICPLRALEPEYATWAEPKRLVVVDGASHFFDRQLGPLGDALREALAGPAAGLTSEVT